MDPKPFEPKPSDNLLDQALGAIHGEPIDATALDAAAGRVWQRLAAAGTGAAPAGEIGPGLPTIEGCSGFQALMPAFLRGALEPAHRLLVEDHSRECVACRRALGALRRGDAGGEVAARPVSAAKWRWPLAAGLATLMVGAGLTAWRMGAPGSTEAQVRSIVGELQRVGASGATLAAGERFRSGEVVRTANGSSAVLELEDGSQVEMAERSEVRLERRRGGLVIDLERGGVIVEAARQPSARRLFVRTGDCTVAVAGTIFSVSHGAKGSRVSVIEGEVEIQGGARTVRADRAVTAARRLGPGDQWATRTDLISVPLDHEIAWSHNAGAYRARLQALHTIGQELDQALIVPGRTSTRLLDVMPADTVVYLAAPNVSSSLGEAWDRLRDRLNDDPELRAWWDQHFGGGDSTHQADVDEYLAELREFGAELGPEIAVAVGQGTMAPGGDGDPLGEPGPPVLAAEVPRPETFSALLDAEIERLNQRAGDHPHLRRVTVPPASPPAQPAELLVWLHGDVLLASPDGRRLLEVGTALDLGGQSAFAGTTFHTRIAAIYAAGAGWVAAVDVSRLVSDEVAAGGKLGVADLDHIVFNSTTGGEGDGSQHRAVFKFARERRGVASWLAAPSPVGALDFVSPEAHFAAAGVFKDPDDMLADVLALADATGQSGFRGMDNERLIALRQDLASALGGDVALAIDGPWLPQPSWKLVVEVYDRDRLHASIEALVREWNRAASEREDTADAHQMALSEEQVGGHVVYRVARVDGGQGAIHFLYEDGYFVAGPNRALLLDSISQRAAGISLAHTARFTDLLPRDHEVHFSAVVYQDLGAVSSALGDWLAQKNDLSAGDRDAIQALATSGGPGLVVAYGGSDQIELVGRSQDGLLGLSFRRLLGLAALASHREAPEAPVEGATVRRVARKIA